MKNLKNVLVLVVSIAALNCFADENCDPDQMYDMKQLMESNINELNNAMNNPSSTYDKQIEGKTVKMPYNETKKSNLANEINTISKALNGCGTMGQYLALQAVRTYNGPSKCGSGSGSGVVSTGSGGVSAGAGSDYPSVGLPQGEGRGLKANRGATNF